MVRDVCTSVGLFVKPSETVADVLTDAELIDLRSVLVVVPGSHELQY